MCTLHVLSFRIRFLNIVGLKVAISAKSLLNVFVITCEEYRVSPKTQLQAYTLKRIIS